MSRFAYTKNGCLKEEFLQYDWDRAEDEEKQVAFSTPISGRPKRRLSSRNTNANGYGAAVVNGGYATIANIVRELLGLERMIPAANVLEATFPCACPREMKGVFSYTRDGCLKEEFCNTRWISQIVQNLRM
ncbi:hypothetical protein R1sor_023539 [Riccia sorocarpa]|uniref:Uncharacterized protein n=1 Tax=Riccia sorocarpa TaxID=122646 RepID=A0ABD3GMY0_9MARC